jgi:hypothetical protein
MTQTPDNGGPAFPVTIQTSDDSTETYFGMTLRDWFAGQALTGLLGAEDDFIQDLIERHETCSLSALSYRMADAMIAARKGGDA